MHKFVIEHRKLIFSHFLTKNLSKDFFGVKSFESLQKELKMIHALTFYKFRQT